MSDTKLVKIIPYVFADRTTGWQPRRGWQLTYVGIDQGVDARGNVVPWPAYAGRGITTLRKFGRWVARQTGAKFEDAK